MPTTSNFGWTTPADTDLVKDGASAIRTLGNNIDTSLVDLKGGTTGQVLSKNSNTDMDFTWVAQDDSNAIQNALLTTTGDTIYASGASTPARLGIGSTGQVLTVSGGLPVWADAAGGGATLISTINASAATTVSFTSIPTTYKHLILVWEEVYNNSNLNYYWSVRLNNDSGSDYENFGVHRNSGGSLALVTGSLQNRFGDSAYYAPIMPTANGNDLEGDSYGFMWIYDYANTTTSKTVTWSSTSKSVGGDSFNHWCDMGGRYRDSAESAITRIDFIRSNATPTLTGTFKLYGV